MMSRVVVFVLVVVFGFGLVSCRPSKDNPQVMCKLPEARGHCRALIPRWRYDPSTGKCREFKFGGCDGNENNFSSQKMCMAFCSVTIVSSAEDLLVAVLKIYVVTFF
ncbi:hypothetical protein NQ317_003433 [Molorchus minor]|uniref:BPTI/Kunitz inhibitor domain-containing protein n=1 Tax=Molorchus minor TaxID=1323400 RepID=A0ABQ9J1Y3_9CUCU|nr:hypothetical protein NQ317_003433 [Molorchus minor]